MLDAECDVYFVVPGAVTDSALLEEYVSLLSEGESVRWQRFVFPSDRHDFLVSHALVRVALSQHAKIPPAEWTFAKNAYGRPEIAGPVVDGLSFSLSHTRDFAAVAIARGRGVGVDVEHLARRMPEEVLKSAFSPGEISALRRLPPEKRHERFFHLWTLKEAYAKARGFGLSLSFPKITFDLDAPPPIMALLGPELTDEAPRWSFTLMQPTSAHCLAVACEADGGRRVRIDVRELVPLAWILAAPSNEPLRR
jgi:4'-phosphopantetheinyl transferase